MAWLLIHGAAIFVWVIDSNGARVQLEQRAIVLCEAPWSSSE
jgi:hypothetical protein